MDLADFFADRPESRQIFDAVRAEIEAFGPSAMRVSKSQVDFRRGRLFAATWIPDRYLHGRHAPLVLTLFLPYRLVSDRFKEVVEPTPGRFTHHLELAAVDQVESEVRRLLELAWDSAA